MEWIKKHYDGVILCLAAVFLLISAFLAYSMSLQFEGFYAERSSAKPRDHTVAEPPLEVIEQVKSLLTEPKNWASHAGSLLASRIYILKDGELFDPVDSGETMLHPPVPNAWLIEHALDYSQTDILESDSDGDGFTVLEEFRAGTNPADPKSVPPYWTKLRLREYKRIPFKVKYSGSPDGGETFTINFIDNPAEPTRFLQLGDPVQIAGVPYKVLNYEEITVTENDIRKDVSELTIQDASGKQIVLVNDQVVDSPTSFAIFQNLLNLSTFEVKKGDSFTIEQEPGIEYQVVEISEREALIRNTASGETHQIPQ